MQNNIVFLLVLTVISYWYNIEIVTYSIVGNQSLRLYDFTFFILIIYTFKISPIYFRIKLKNFEFLTKFYYFTIFVTFSLLLVFIKNWILGDFFYFLQSILYVYHLWGFFSAAFFFNFIIQNISQFKKFVQIIIILIFIENFIIISQNLGLIGSLWPEKWQNVYGYEYLTGTFGPNRIVPGMASFFSLVFSILIYYSYFNKTLNLKFKYMNIINIFILPVVIILSSSKTSMITALLFFLFLIIFSKKIFNLIFFVFFFIVVYILILPKNIKDRLNFVFEDRFEKYSYKTKEAIRETDNILIGTYKSQGTGRYEIAEIYINTLLDKPYLIITGSGVNNRINLIGDSAHNMYLSLLGELGIFGLYLYLIWLKTLFNNSSNFRNMEINDKNIYFLKNIKRSFNIAVVISLFFGEHLYLYRTSYGLLGMFLLFVLIFDKIINYERDNRNLHSML